MKPHIYRDGYTKQPWVCRSKNPGGSGYYAARGMSPATAFWKWFNDYGRYQ